MKQKLGWFVLVAAALTSSGRLAHAQGAAPGAAQSEVDRAVSLAHEGRSLYDEGRFDEALTRFRAADRIAHSPLISLYIARCERNLTHLVAAREAYRAAANEALAPDAPAPFTAAKADAARELAALEPRIPRVAVGLPGATEATKVLLDGVVVPAASRAEPLWVDPGEHVLARSDGGPTVEQRFRAVEGATPLTVELAAGAAAATTGAEREPETPASREASEGTLVPGLVVLAVGVVGLGVGTATGLVASSKTSDIEDRCVDGHCLISDKEAGDTAGTFATVSTISFIAGGLAAAGGVVLLLTLGADGDEASASREHIEIAPTVGGARGTWVF